MLQSLTFVLSDAELPLFKFFVGLVCSCLASFRLYRSCGECGFEEPAVTDWSLRTGFQEFCWEGSCVEGLGLENSVLEGLGLEES